MKHAFCLLALGMGTLTLTACGGNDNSTHHTTPVAHTHETAPSTTPSNSNTTTTPSATAQFQTKYELSADDDTRKTLKQHLNINDFSLDDTTANGVPTKSLSQFPQGLSTQVVRYAGIVKDNNKPIVAQNTLRIYQQPNSVVIGLKSNGVQYDGKSYFENAPFGLELMDGNPTKTLPTAGTFNYVGKAFNENSEGSFNYAIDFGAKTGQGSFNLNGKSAKLDKSAINPHVQIHSKKQNKSVQAFGIAGTISGDYQGKYGLVIFGDHAEEVLGGAEAENGSPIIFGGSKQ